MTVNLYSTNCRNCAILENSLQEANIEFNKITDFDPKFLVKKGFLSAPVLEVDGKFMKYGDALKWVNGGK